MTLKELLKELNKFNINEYGNCQVCRSTGHWDGCPVESVEIADMVNDITGKLEDCIFIY